MIGLSNGYIGNEWRNQMVASAQQQFEGYKERGMASRLEILHAGVDVDQQVRDLRDMIRQGVTVITLNANSATALNGVISEAKRANIPVVAFDRKVTNPYALNITVDYYTWGQRYAQWIADTLKGHGKVVLLDGVPGHPAAEACRKAAFDTLHRYPGVEIVWSGYGEWDHAKAQNVMATVIATQPEIDGAFVEELNGPRSASRLPECASPHSGDDGRGAKAFPSCLEEGTTGGHRHARLRSAEPARHQP